MARCSYCKKQSSGQKTAIRVVDKGSRHTRELPYCSEGCKQSIHKFIDSHNLWVPRFRTILMIWTLAFFGAILMQVVSANPMFKSTITPVVLAFIGIILMIYPAGTMDLKYYERIGIKWFSLYIRLTGLIIIFTAGSIMRQPM